MRGLVLFSAPLPALIAGVLVMQRSGISPGIWVQQLAAGLALMALCVAFTLAPRWRGRLGSPLRGVHAVAALLLLAATLAQPGLEGVRRWVPVGPLQLHAAFIALPILLVVFVGIQQAWPSRTTSWTILLASTIAAIVLVLQPDASQATAFCVAVVVLLVARSPRARSDWLTAGIVVVAAFLAWTRADPLAPVPHVEGIIGLAVNAGTVWVVTSLLALAVLPMPFIADALGDGYRNRSSLALAAYFAVAAGMPALGPYPVPILGYGVAPLLGYFAALGWIILKNAS